MEKPENNGYRGVKFTAPFLDLGLSHFLTSIGLNMYLKV